MSDQNIYSYPDLLRVFQLDLLRNAHPLPTSAYYVYVTSKNAHTH
jgi:hypothetical protein